MNLHNPNNNLWEAQNIPDIGSFWIDLKTKKWEVVSLLHRSFWKEVDAQTLKNIYNGNRWALRNAIQDIKWNLADIGLELEETTKWKMILAYTLKFKSGWAPQEKKWKPSLQELFVGLEEWTRAHRVLWILYARFWEIIPTQELTILLHPWMTKEQISKNTLTGWVLDLRKYLWQKFPHLEIINDNGYGLCFKSGIIKRPKHTHVPSKPKSNFNRWTNPSKLKARIWDAVTSGKDIGKKQEWNEIKEKQKDVLWKSVWLFWKTKIVKYAWYEIRRISATEFEIKYQDITSQINFQKEQEAELLIISLLFSPQIVKAWQLLTPSVLESMAWDILWDIPFSIKDSIKNINWVFESVWLMITRLDFDGREYDSEGDYYLRKK